MKHTHKSVAVLAAGLLVVVGAGGTYAATKSSGQLSARLSSTTSPSA